MNLMINARDEIAPKGKITVRTRLRTEVDTVCSSCHTSFSGNYIELSITDSGKGISKENLSKVFEPFFSTKEPGRGSGMGLSMVHGIMHGHDGHILVNSGKHGTRFTLLFPVTNHVGETETYSDNSEPSHNAEQPPKTASGHIMIVDDEVQVSNMISELLNLNGYETSVFNDSSFALATFKKSPDSYDLVISDQTMPNLTGIELASLIRAIRPDLPIILCTGYSDAINDETLDDLNIKHVYHKPVDNDTLLNSIHSYLS
jgi:CheY-like chemotaxis protein